MKLTPKDCKQKIIDNNGSKILEYPFEENALSIATSEIKGRYPNKGYAVNTNCDQVYLILKGDGVIEIADQKEMIKLNEGDAFFIQKHTPYAIFGDYIKLVIANSPARDVTQYKLIE